jgi:4-hydroxybenzoyl-CoA reductase subunit beta
VLRMPEFELQLPRTPAEAVALRASLPDSLYVAGGTDLLPNLKHHLRAPKALVSLARVEGLDAIERQPDGGFRLGARVTLHRLATSELLQRELPGLSLAASLVAGPQHRLMGTLGGNIMLDTRCLFYNQSREWREALGYCLKAEGTWCHVIGSAKACVAAQSSDTVPVLVGLGASVEVLAPDGSTRHVPLRELWTKDGRVDRNHTVPDGSLVTAVLVPAPAPGHRSTYRKVRTRAAVDYPQLGIAAVAAFEGEQCTALDVVIGAMLPHPKLMTGLEGALGTRWTDSVVEHLAEAVFKQARPQPQLHGDPTWRRHLARAETRRALLSLMPR